VRVVVLMEIRIPSCLELIVGGLQFLSHPSQWKRVMLPAAQLTRSMALLCQLPGTFRGTEGVASC
jgi:uncharacterized protein YjeT (DUF2065 family)